MMLIRAVETRLMTRRDHGFQLLSSGEEAVAVGVCAPLAANDQLLSSGRAIGPALARGLETGAVMAELLGRQTGTNQGRGGRGHIAQPAKGFFGAHAVVGGNLTVAAGAALAAQQAEARTVVVCIFGDGACGSGALHETLNIAALWRLPLVLVCNNNGMSVSTPPAEALAPNPLSVLAGPFGIPAETIDGMDVVAVAEAATACVAHARAGKGPAFLECRSERFSSHSTATRDSRPPEAIAAIRSRCPIAREARALEEAGLLGPEAFASLEREVESEVDRAVAFADSSPFPDADEALQDVW
jgi:pyruvate dehydrogenase E1 component alpha subunit